MNTATRPQKAAAVLWTGGKDCSLALHEATDCDVQCLVTFAPPQPKFLAHPVCFMQLQAQALGLPHYLWTVTDPHAASYEAGLRWLRDEIGVSTVITGDIAEVAGAPNWIRECNRSVDLNVLTPLWGRDRQSLLEQVLAAGFNVLFSCIKKRWLSEDWVGRQLHHGAIEELRVIRASTGLDLCGEEGEYHTLVTDGPEFQRRIVIHSSSTRVTDSLAYLEIGRTELKSK